MGDKYTQAELEAYLDESLDVELMAEIEREIRNRPELLDRLKQINARRDSGFHTLAEIWRRNQIGIPSREELGSYLLGVLPEEHAGYIRFRIEKLRCRFTIANLRDLEAQQQESDSQVVARRRKYFRSSVHHLKD
jgi:hypothetical protein